MNRFVWIAGFPGILALGIFLIVPLAWLLAQGLGSFSGYASFLQLKSLLGLTYGQALLSALLSGVVGVAGALLISEQRFFGRMLLVYTSSLIFSFPPLLYALAFIGFWGRQGWVSKWVEPDIPVYGWFGVLMAHVFFNFPIFLKPVSEFLLRTDRAQEKVALSLGASRFHTFVTITLPRLKSVLWNSFLVAFLYCGSSFLIVLLLGGGPAFSTLEVAIYQAIRVELNLPLAVQYAVIQGGLLAVLSLLSFEPVSVRGTTRSEWVPLFFFRNNTFNHLATVSFLAIIFLIAWGPLLSFLVDGARGLVQLNTETLGPLWNSLQLCVLTAGLSGVVGLSLAYFERALPSSVLRRSVVAAASLPIGISTLLLSFAWMVSYRDFFFHMRGNLLLIAVIQSMGILPFVFRIFRQGLARIPSRLIQAGSSLGATPAYCFRSIEWPLLRPTGLLALAVAASYSLGEVGSVLLLLSGDMATLPLWIYRKMGQYRFEEAYGVAILLIGVSMGIQWLTAHLERKT